MFVKNIASLASFHPEKMGKSTVVAGGTLFAGLNCFEPGQQHEPHVHEGQDKLYFVLEGSAAIHIGGETEHLSAGDAAFAPSGVVHGIVNPGPGRLVVMAVLAPPPKPTTPKA